MTEFDSLEPIDQIRRVLSIFPEETFNREGYVFTYKAAKMLVDRIDDLEMELELTRALVPGDDLDACERDALHRLITSARMAITTNTQDDAEKMTARDLLDQAVELIEEEQERSVPRVVPVLRAQIEAEIRAKVADEISAMKLPWVNNDGFTEHLLDSVRMDAAAIARGESQ